MWTEAWHSKPRVARTGSRQHAAAKARREEQIRVAAFVHTHQSLEFSLTLRPKTCGLAWRLHPCLSISTEHLRLALLWAVCPP